jgi:hypothetical protein
MPQQWQLSEVHTIVTDYFSMLKSELEQKPYSKTIHRNQILPILVHRSEGSIEFKHQNISAVLSTMGLPYIKGYKPRYNFQGLLAESVNNYVEANKSRLIPLFEKFADEYANVQPNVIDFDSVLGEEPEPTPEDVREPSFRPIKINYLQREQSNRNLGQQGEEFVILYERHRLQKEGKPGLADKIEWISRDQGDGAGFDILSKNKNGTDRFLEVKTTKLNKETPIFLTRTELKFAQINDRNFYLYRVYQFTNNPMMFIKQGSYENFCRLEAETFKGRF